MKTALITTTINVPHVLKLYRKLGPDVVMFVAGDKHPNSDAIREFCDGMEFVHYDDAERTEELGYKCSELIGWNCVERRNIALLEAVKWGADCVVTIDDDNIPISGDYFGCFHRALTSLRGAENQLTFEPPGVFDGLEASSPTGWFDPGSLLVPATPHRGYPYAQKAAPVFESVVDARIGVAAGLCLGDPDVDAVTRIANAPIVHSVSELGRAGVVGNPQKTKTVFNTQNTSFIRELAPAFFQPPGVGRFSDIYASLICQRVMAERGLHVHFGQPFVWQQRNQHNLINDLRQEIDGMENIENFARALDSIPMKGETITRQVRALYSYLANGVCTYFPKAAGEAALAFLDDMESVL